MSGKIQEVAIKIVIIGQKKCNSQNNIQMKGFLNMLTAIVEPN